MKTMKIVMLLCAAMFACSCTHDPSDGGFLGLQTKDNGMVTIQISVPSNTTPTRSGMSSDDEYAVEEVQVLLFNSSNNTYKGAYTGTALVPTGTVDTKKSVKFDVMLPTGEWNMMVVANAEDIVEKSGIKEGDARIDIVDKLCATMGNAGWDVKSEDVKKLPMWGLEEGYEVGSGAKLPTIQLIRMVAKVNIALSDALITKESFELKSVRVYNYAKTGRLVPQEGGDIDWSAITQGPFGELDTPTLPDPFEKADRTKDEWIDYAIPSPNEELRNHIYLFEAPEGVGPSDPKYTENTCLVIGGSYDGNPTTYYRIDFAVPDKKDKTKTDFLPLLRNNSYTITIANVGSNGEPTPEEALESTATNIDTEIMHWNDNEINDISFDGVHYFAISTAELFFSPFGDEEYTVRILTDIDDFTLTLDDGDEDDDNDAVLTAPSGGGTSAWSDDDSFWYTLKKTDPGVYTLRVQCKSTNASNDNPGDRVEQWTIKAGRMSKTFTATQKWHTDYIMGPPKSHVNPEGTSDENPVMIQVLATSPAEAEIDFGDEDPWFEIDGAEGLSTDYDGDGVYLAKLNIDAEPYPYDDDPKAPATRSADITIDVANGETKTFTITQDMAYLFFSSRVSNLQEHTPKRPAEGEPGKKETITVNVTTNLPVGELKLAPVDGNDPRITLKSPEFVYLNSSTPRSPTFYVDVDLTTTPNPLPPKAFSGSFTVSADTEEWGDLPPLTVQVRVPSGKVSVLLYWLNAVFNDGFTTWTPGSPDETKGYLFPWNTEALGIKLVSDGGLVPDNQKMVLGTGGKLTPGTEVDNDDGTIDYPFTYEFGESPTGYVFAFRPEDPNGEAVNVPFSRAAQSWDIDKTTLAVDYNGASTGTTDHSATITTNVDWSVAAKSDDYDGWLRAEEGKAATAASNSLDGTTLTSDAGNLLTAPKVATPPSMPVMTVTKKLHLKIDAITTLNAYESDEYKRTVELSFRNESKGEDLVKKLAVTQHAPVLKYVSGLPAEGAEIPHEGETYTLKVQTNLTGWTVKAYDESDAVIATSDVHTDAAALTATERTASITIPQNAGSDRMLTFKLVHSLGDVEIGEWTQKDNVIELPKPTKGAPAPPGIVGVSESGVLTIRGSVEFASDYTLNQYATENFGGLSSEKVYVALFRWGGLVALNSATKDGTTRWNGLDDVMWTPPGYDISWLTDKTMQTMNKIPYATGTTFPSNQPAAAGLGDPCYYAEGGGSGNWRMVNASFLSSTIEGVASNSGAIGIPDQRVSLSSRYIDLQLGSAINMGSDYYANTNALQVGTPFIYWTKGNENNAPIGVIVANYFYPAIFDAREYRPVRCVPQSTGTLITPAEFLYWDESTQKMQVGKWHGRGGPVTFQNVLRFRAGSVWGLIEGDEIGFSTNDVVFRPGAYNSGTETFANIPQWNNYDDLGGDKTGWEYISDYFSTPLYHNIENVIRGFGDPCKLAGLTLQQVETGTIDNGTYRMARYNEMIWYMKETAQQSGTTYYGLSAGDTYLPSFDNLTTSGAMPATTKRNQGARFWVSRPGSSSSGQSLGYDNNGAVTIKSENTGNVVRCVRQ